MADGSKVAFIGLGVMGYPMAGYLATNGHQVTVYNRTVTKAEAWVEQHGGQVAATPRAAADGADIVFACVGNDDDVRSVTLGEEGALDGMTAGSIFVDHTTASADLARELYRETANRGIGFLDAPVSGGQAGAENGALTVMVGGDVDIFERAQPVIDCYALACERMGEAGTGQLAKMVNQICIAGVVQGLSEAINFGLKADLDMAKVIDVISKGATRTMPVFRSPR
jgi:3-hydroxyisobutyrate dehydrogenase-like beta-hydroxyacid dehydrogenase